MRESYDVTEKVYSVVKQLLIILSVVLAFLTAACSAKWASRESYTAAYVIVLLLDVLCIAGWVLLGVRAFRESEAGFDLLGDLVRNRGILIAMCWCFVTRIVQFGDMPRWDSMTYYKALYKACENFNFTFSQYWNAFALAAHPTRGYASLVAIGEFLFPRKYVGVMWVNLVLTLFATVCFYKMLRKILRKCSWIYCTLATCIAFSTSMFLGTFSYFQPDAGIPYMMIFALYFYMERKYILMCFFMLVLIQTKEVGILAVGGIVMGAFLWRMVKGKEKTIVKRFIGFFREPLGVISLLGAVVGAAYLVIRFKNGVQMWSYGKDLSPYMSTFSFQPVFIGFKMKQFFLLNFNWLLWSGNVALFILALKRTFVSRKAGRKMENSGELLCIIACVAGVMALFYSLYITFVLPRYQITIDFCAGVLFAILLPLAVPKLRARNIVAAAVGILVFIQAYVTIDPVSKFAFETIDTGNGKIICENILMGGHERDYTVYNHQFNYYDKALDSILREVGYHEGMDILIWKNDVNTCFYSNGFYWDMEEDERTLNVNENTAKIHGFAKQDETFDSSLGLQEEAVFIRPEAISQDYVEAFLNEYYEIRYKGEVTVPFGGKLSFYVCDLISERLVQN